MEEEVSVLDNPFFMDFPAEECVIPLEVNRNFFKSETPRLVTIYDNNEETLIIKNLYPCLGEVDEGQDIYGYVKDNGLEFYSFENSRYIIKNVTKTEDLEDFLTKLKTL